MSDKTLSHKGYCGTIEISIEDNCLFGKILFINDLVTYEADTPSKLQTAFEGAVEHYLQKCASENVAPDKPFSGSFNIRIAPELHREASMKAAIAGTTLNDFVRECIETCVADS